MPAERDRLNRRINELEDQIRSTIEVVLEEILPEAFATVKESARRLVETDIVVTGTLMKWDMVPYDVQLIGGIASSATRESSSSPPRRGHVEPSRR